MKHGIESTNPQRAQLIRVTVDGGDIGVGILDSLGEVTWTNLNGDTTKFANFGLFEETITRTSVRHYDWRIALKPVRSVVWSIVVEGERS